MEGQNSTTLGIAADLFNWNANEVNGYNVSDLVFKFENLTRYNSNFKPSDNATIFNEYEYSQSMVMYFLMGSIISIVLSSFLLVSCCCMCIVKSSKPIGQKKKPQKSRSLFNFLVIGLSIAGASTFIIGFVGIRHIKSDGKDICTLMNDTFKQMEEIKSFTDYITNNTIKNILTRLGSDIQHITQEANNVPSPEVREKIVKFSSQYDDFKQKVNSYLDKLKNQNYSEIFDNFLKLFQKIVDNCAPSIEDMFTVYLCILIIISILFLLFVFVSVNECVRVTVSLFGYSIGFTLTFVLGIVFFVLLSASADVCLYGKPYVINREPSIEYYLLCPSKQLRSLDMSNNTYRYDVNNRTLENSETRNNIQSSPYSMEKMDNIGQIFEEIQEYHNQSMQIVKQLRSEINDVSNSINCPNPQMPQLEQMCQYISSINETLNNELFPLMNNISNKLNHILNIVECENITPKINFLLNIGCTTLYESIYLLFISSSVSFIIYFIILFIVILLSF